MEAAIAAMTVARVMLEARMAAQSTAPPDFGQSRG
jgi:hypothetical protein